MGDSGPGARVDFVVRVPEGVRFLGSTVNGGVEADALKSDVQAYTVNGQVRVSTTGTVQAKTVNGSITASLLKPFWSKPPELSTVNGGIRLVLPPSANAALQAATKNGKIVTDFDAKGKVTDQEVVGPHRRRREPARSQHSQRNDRTEARRLKRVNSRTKEGYLHGSA